jgi:phenylacetate-coenzyme A ligase PaaK-like adenylate-forming protein
VLKIAAEELPFYRERFSGAGFDPARFRTLDDLQAVPICNKDDLLAGQRTCGSHKLGIECRAEGRRAR